MNERFLYRVGGSLAWNDPTYVKRQVDSELRSAIAAGQFAYVLGPRQVGKSSLRVHTRHRLVQQGYQCITLYANQMSDRLQPDPSADPLNGQWATRLMTTIWDGLHRSDDKRADKDRFFQWLKSSTVQLPSARLDYFVQNFLTAPLQRGPLVIFIDEIEALLALPFGAAFFRWIASCYERKGQPQQENEIYQKLNFVILGSAIASEMPQYDALFASGCNVSLSPFQHMEIYTLQQGFEEKIDNPTAVLKAVFRWTHGQPFLTQKLCQILTLSLNGFVQPSFSPLRLSIRTINHWVDETVRSQIIKNWPTQDEPVHLRAISDRIARSPNKAALVSLYENVLNSETGLPFKGSYTEAELLLSGLVIAEDNQLKVANDIYRQVFVLK
ncbi:MAG: AAA-like domain-containing protein [Cyanobacteria bacterium J06649_4]